MRIWPRVRAYPKWKQLKSFDNLQSDQMVNDYPDNLPLAHSLSIMLRIESGRIDSRAALNVSQDLLFK